MPKNGRDRSDFLLDSGSWLLNSMVMNLVQFKDARGDRRVGIPSKDGSELRILNGFSSVYDLALAALKAGRTLAELAETQLSERTEAYDAVVDERRLLVPLD